MLILKRFLSSQVVVWAIVIVFILAGLLWLSFGAGQLAGAKWQSQQEKVVGFKTWNEMSPVILGNGKNGRIIVMEDKTIYIDPHGRRWGIADFKQMINQADLAAIQAAQIPLEGAVTIDVKPTQIAGAQLALASHMKTTGNTAIGVLEVALAATLIYFVIKMMTRGDLFGNRFNRSKKNTCKTRYQDVAGLNGPKQEVMEIVDYLRHPERFLRTGARPPTGILLYGPPGNGKTLLAKAIAGEADAEFLEQNASSFVQLYVGAGAMAVRALFKEARKKRPCVIFIDEIDAVGGKRQGSSGGANDERLQTLNALLAELDGFQGNEGIVVIAATNRLEDLDEALARPGRFDRKVMAGLPGRGDRLEILKVHLHKLPKHDVALEKWAAQTQGFSGADLANLVNEAAIEAARRNGDCVTEQDFLLARDRVLMGPKSFGHRLNEAENRIIAYHETGHALLRTLKSNAKVSKVSILPRGKSLGVTITDMPEEQMFHTRERVHEELLVLMGGRAAEEVFCGRVSTGAANDMERASQLARDAMKNYGFGDWGPYIPQHKDLIAETERAAARWLNEVYSEAVSILKDHTESVHLIAQRLMAEEEIEGEVVENILASTLKKLERSAVAALA